MLKASSFTQNDLLKVKTKVSTDTPVMVTTFNPNNPDIKGFIHDNWNIIEYSKDCSQTFNSKPLVGFKRLPNLRNLLTKAEMAFPPTHKETKVIRPPMCTRLGKCTYCPLINKISEVECKTSHNKTKVTQVPKHITCELSDIVYLITCSKCGKYYVGETGRAFRHRIYEHKLSVSKPKETRITPVSKHFTEKGHSVRDMKFSRLEWCSLKYNTPKSEHRKMREKWWMWNIGAIHPIGINQFI